MSNKNKLINSHVHNPGAVLEFRTDTVELANGEEFNYQKVAHPGAVVILPINERNEIMLVEQYRYCVDRVLLELPAGKLEKTDSSPIETAKRELQEEIGFAARAWVDLGSIFPAPGFSDEVQYLFFANDLYPSKLLGDPDEEIVVRSLSAADLVAAVRDGIILDAKSISLIYLAVLKGLLKY